MHLGLVLSQHVCYVLSSFLSQAQPTMEAMEFAGPVYKWRPRKKRKVHGGPSHCLLVT